MYDVAIIGLGPAGSTLARLLDPSLKVAAIDRKADEEGPGFRKPCGGLLAPDAQKALALLGLTLPKSLLVDPQIFSVRTIDLDTGLTRYYQRFYINLDRHRLDLWLRDLIPPGVELFPQASVLSVERRADGFRVGFLQRGARKTIGARRVVGADGASSVVRNALFPRCKPRSYVSIQQWFPDSSATPFYSCVFDSKNTDCYSWGLSKDGSFLFGGAYPAQGCRARFEDQKQRLGAHGFSLKSPLRTEACLVLRPSRPGDFCLGGDGAFLVGEAAGFISPSSLEGVSGALGSAIALARALRPGEADPHAAYRRGAAALRLRLLGKLLKCPFMYQPALRGWVMRSGLGAIRPLP